MHTAPFWRKVKAFSRSLSNQQFFHLTTFKLMLFFQFFLPGRFSPKCRRSRLFPGNSKPGRNFRPQTKLSKFPAAFGKLCQTESWIRVTKSLENKIHITQPIHKHFYILL